MTSAGEVILYQRYNQPTGWEQAAAQVIVEASVTLSVNGEAWLSFACTPLQLEALAVGFLFNEGFLQDRGEIGTVEVCAQGTNIDVWLHHAVARPSDWQRTSGCTGGFTTTSHADMPQINGKGAPITPGALLANMEQLIQSQSLYREMGGVHSSAISDGREIRIQAEDIGRHNTLDKLAGQLLMEAVDIQPRVILTTGRVSAEMLQKSARIGAAIVVSRTSPTSQSVALAQKVGITLVGYARRNSFLVYSHPEQITALSA